nr:exodeoxyribonuclease VII small subunit [uncultured Rhodoferax sp.]
MPKARSSHPDTPALPATYEEAMAELEGLVARLESGDLPLDQLLTNYQRGAALLQHCREKLQAVEDQIKVLDDGVLKPWKAQ